MSLSDVIPPSFGDHDTVKRAHVAEWLRIDLKTLQRWEDQGKLPKSRRLSPRLSVYVAGELRAALRKLDEEGAAAGRK